MKLQLGDIYWLKLNSDYKHPHVVIALTDDRVTVCAITTNANKANSPGNVLLESGEGNLHKQSIVDVANVSTIDQDKLGDFIGKLTLERVEEIKNGIGFLERTYLGNLP